MSKIILLNGPPFSGKDTAAKHIRTFAQVGYYRPLLDRMSMPIKKAFAGYVGAPITQDGEVTGWEEQKDVPSAMLNGKSYRQWQIDFSEKFIKPLYGEDAFARLMVERIDQRFRRGIANLMVIPDLGFQVEVQKIYDAFPQENILLIRCYRQGFDFSGDSRNYVRAPKGAAVFAPLNNSTIEAYNGQIEAGVKLWLQSPEALPREA